MTKTTSKPERLLRMPDGSYATQDGRFYAERVSSVWLATDAMRAKSVLRSLNTLTECRAWFASRRRRAK